MHLRSAAKRAISEQANIDSGEKGITSVALSPETRRDHEPPVKKRRRTGVAGHASKRRGLNQLCIDELYIIFAYVYPMDLLNLARTCKYLRSVLMHKSSQFLWKDALVRVEGLPDCPSDLTEPQYTNLVFYNRCHVCDKPSTSVLWNLRRRYCAACKVQRLRDASDFDCSMLFAIPHDDVTMGRDGLGVFVDKDLHDSFLHEYHSSTDKERFLEERRNQCQVICTHANSCLMWQQKHGRVKRFDLEILRKERETSIIERLRQHGYGPELAYFDQSSIRDSYKSAFKPHTPLTDGEWEQMLPKWIKVMTTYRWRRLDATCYHARRKLLVPEYDNYVRSQTLSTPMFDLLPHVADLASFPPFRDVIEAPEDVEMGEEPFASAFAQLPVLLGEWREQLDIGLAELIEIPPHLMSQDTSSGDTMESSGATSNESHSKGLAKLHLACALFKSSGRNLFAYPDVFLTSMRYRRYPPIPGVIEYRTRADTIQERFNASFLEEAPYIVHACGLDPNVATADDMDRRNARLTCLVCEGSHHIVMDWRDAMLHASSVHMPYSKTLVPLFESPRWQVVSDEHIAAIQAVEKWVEERSQFSWRRCLLCRPRVGDALREHCYEYIRHMQICHGLETRDLQKGVHYERLGLEGSFWPHKVEMLEEGGQVVFRRSQNH